MAVVTTYKKSSPYGGTPYLEGKFLDIWNYKTIPPQADDIFTEITATYQFRPDLMSFDLYGTVEYWWVFIMRNRDVLRDPIFDFTTGTGIYIPKLSTIQSNIG